jgi:tmRNA-binding protein
MDGIHLVPLSVWQEIVRIKLAIAIANAKGSAVDLSELSSARESQRWSTGQAVATFDLLER